MKKKMLLIEIYLTVLKGIRGIGNEVRSTDELNSITFGIAAVLGTSSDKISLDFYFPSVLLLFQ